MHPADSRCCADWGISSLIAAFPMWRYEAKLFIRVDVSFPVDDSSAEFEILGSDSFMPPPLKGGLADAP